MKRLQKSSLGDKQTGFRSPAQDWAEGQLDLNSKLVPHPSSTFFFRAETGAEYPAGLYTEDLLIVDRSLSAAPGDLVVVVRGGELEVGPLPPAIHGSAEHVEVWGVVTHVVHNCRRR